MLVVMKRGATQHEIDAVVARIEEFGITPVPLPGAERMAIGTFGSTSRAAGRVASSLPSSRFGSTVGDDPWSGSSLPSGAAMASGSGIVASGCSFKDSRCGPT